MNIGTLIQLQKMSLQNSEARLPRDCMSADFLFHEQNNRFEEWSIFLILITQVSINDFRVLFSSFIENKSYKESDQQ